MCRPDLSSLLSPSLSLPLVRSLSLFFSSFKLPSPEKFIDNLAKEGVHRQPPSATAQISFLLFELCLKIALFCLLSGALFRMLTVALFLCFLIYVDYCSPFGLALAFWILKGIVFFFFCDLFDVCFKDFYFPGFIVVCHLSLIPRATWYGVWALFDVCFRLLFQGLYFQSFKSIAVWLRKGSLGLDF